MPDLEAVPSSCSQLNFDTIGRGHVQMLTTWFVWSHVTLHGGVHMHPLDLSLLRIILYAYASLPNKADYSTQLGFLILLTENSARARPIWFSS